MSLYNADGSFNVTLVDGNTLVGLQAPDGSYNVVLSDGSTLTGLYHPCGAYNGVLATLPSQTGRPPSGGIYISSTANYIPGTTRVTDASGTLYILPSSMNSVKPDVYVNFKTNKAYLKSTGATVNADTLLSVSRASSATQVDSLGNWTQFGSNTLARSDLGAAIWESRTNSIRNNTMQGAVAGSPGTPPTNWAITASSNGVTRQIVGTGTENGVDYVDIRYFGTPTATFFPAIYPESVTQTASLYGQTWTGSCFLKAVGTQTGLTALSLNIGESPGSLVSTTGTFTLPATLTRYNVSRTITDPTNTWVWLRVVTTVTNAVPCDFTIRVGWPQLENNSLINSTVASANIAAAGSGGTNGTAVYTIGGGTGTAAKLNVTIAGGVLSSIDSVNTAGSYTVLPPSPATLTYFSGTGTGLTGATVTLTPTDNSAKAVASNPTLTTSAAATQAADVVTLNLAGLPSFGTAFSLYAKATPRAPSTYPVVQVLAIPSDGTTSNKIPVYRNTSGAYAMQVTAAGSLQYAPAAGAWPQNTSSKVMAAIALDDARGGYTGTLFGFDATATVPTGINVVGIGNQLSASQLNGDEEEIAIWFTQRVPNAELVSMTT